MTNDNLQRAIDNLNRGLLDTHNNEFFRQALNDAIWILGLKPADIRAEFGVTQDIFRMWLDGTSAPTNYEKICIYEFFLGKANQLLADNATITQPEDR